MRIDVTASGESMIQQIVRALLNRLTFHENMQSSTIEQTTSQAHEVMTIQHNLGKKPKHYIANLDKEGSVYDFDRPAWTDTHMQLICSAPNAKLTLVVF